MLRRGRDWPVNGRKVSQRVRILWCGSILWAIALGACSLRAISDMEPFAFSGKMVRVRAQVKTGFEIAVIQAECDHKAASIALHYPDLMRDSDRPDFSLLKDQNFEQFDQALSRSSSKLAWGLEIFSSSQAARSPHYRNARRTIRRPRQVDSDRQRQQDGREDKATGSRPARCIRLD